MTRTALFQFVGLMYFTVKEGDRIAQLIIEKIETPEITEVDVRILHSSPRALLMSSKDLDATLRGGGGFGSTGGHSTL